MTYPNNPYSHRPHPQLGYEQPYSGYGQPQPGYGNPMPGYGGVQGGYVAQPPACDVPQSMYSEPHPSFGGYSQFGGYPPYASWGTRMGAALVDGVTVGAPAAILYILAFVVGTESASDCAYVQTNSGTFKTSGCGGGLSGTGIALMLLAALIAFAGNVFLIYREGTTGQTPGKKMLGIRLLSETTGQPLGFGTAFLRRICHVADGFPCYVGFLWPLWDAKRQTFADKIVKSIVVRI